MADSNAWWRAGTLYQIYPRSFADSDGDGVGDLRGIVDHLDHLQWLGVAGIWLDPIMVSPNADWGYDVADYCAVDPSFGTLADADALIAAAAERGIRVILDLVPNHTSDQHPWFVDARSSRDSKYRDYYVWADPKPDGSPPNNWTSTFGTGGAAWALDETTGQYYLHNFLDSQPDLNWWNPAVRDEFDHILSFWFDRGVAGFRIDVVHMVIKDRELRDNPPPNADDHWFVSLRGQRQEFNSNRPEVHEVIRRWRAIAETYDPPRVLIGETHVFEADVLGSYYGDDDELNLAFNFLMLHAPFEADALRAVVAQTEAGVPSNGWPVWTGGNHDNYRFPTRWCGNDPAKARAALMMLFGLRGTPFLYYGDELGMPDTDVPRDRVLDPVGIALPGIYGRDPERTPMPWADVPGAGFTAAGVEPWLPFGDIAACNVAAQRHDPDSMLSLTRDLISLRAAAPDLLTGAYVDRTVDGGPWVWTRGARVLVALNLADTPTTVPEVHGAIRIGTDRVRDDERVDGDLRLGPWEGVIFAIDGERG
jgi:alpha-glucosidase